MHSQIAEQACLVNVGQQATITPCMHVQVAEQVCAGQQVEITLAFDMWQLGMLIYEVHAGRPYWSAESENDTIFKDLLDPSRPLPHMRRPVQQRVIQNILAGLMTRTAEDRMSAVRLKAVLSNETNLGDLRVQPPSEAVHMAER
jgi:hypothetical protein